jgi:hypothetical protein
VHLLEALGRVRATLTRVCCTLAVVVLDFHGALTSRSKHEFG